MNSRESLAGDGLTFAGSSGAQGAYGFADGLFVACGLSLGAALIHVQAAAGHVAEYAPFAAFFAVLAVAQVAWAAAVYRWPTSRLVAGGAIVSLAVVVLWLVSRTSGLPIGPTPWTPEPLGAADVIATADEAVLALLAVLHLRSRRATGVRRPLLVGAAAVGVALISLSSLTFMFGGHGH